MSKEFKPPIDQANTSDLNLDSYAQKTKTDLQRLSINTDFFDLHTWLKQSLLRQNIPFFGHDIIANTENLQPLPQSDGFFAWLFASVKAPDHGSQLARHIDATLTPPLQQTLAGIAEFHDQIVPSVTKRAFDAVEAISNDVRVESGNRIAQLKQVGRNQKLERLAVYKALSGQVRLMSGVSPDVQISSPDGATPEGVCTLFRVKLENWASDWPKINEELPKLYAAMLRHLIGDLDVEAEPQDEPRPAQASLRVIMADLNAGIAQDIHDAEAPLRTALDAVLGALRDDAVDRRKKVEARGIQALQVIDAHRAQAETTVDSTAMADEYRKTTVDAAAKARLAVEGALDAALSRFVDIPDTQALLGAEGALVQADIVDTARKEARRTAQRAMVTSLNPVLLNKIFPDWINNIWSNSETRWQDFRARLNEGQILRKDLSISWENRELSKNIAIGQAVAVIDQKGNSAFRPDISLRLLHPQEKKSRTLRRMWRNNP